MEHIHKAQYVHVFKDTVHVWHGGTNVNVYDSLWRSIDCYTMYATDFAGVLEHMFEYESLK